MNRVALYEMVDVGVIAHRLISRKAFGVIAATFSRCVYVEVEDGYICLGDRSIGSGPLNILLAGKGSAPLHFPALGARVRMDDAQLWVGQRCFARSSALPPAGSTQAAALLGWDLKRLSSGVTALAKILESAPVHDGLICLYRPQAQQQSPLIVRYAHRPVLHLRDVIEAHAAGCGAEIHPQLLCNLLGLGPGLTPSGDDLLGGVLLALHAVGAQELARALWANIEPETHRRTHAISRAHLCAAAENYCSQTIRSALTSVLTGDLDSLSEAVNLVGAIGHSSGWDLLTGVCLALQAFANGAAKGHVSLDFATAQ